MPITKLLLADSNLNPQDFISPTAGNVIRSPKGYWTFIPAPLPPSLNWTAHLVDFLIGHPIVTVRQVQKGLNLTDYKTAQRYINKLQSAGILSEITGKLRNRLFRASQILKTLEEPINKQI